MERLINQTGKLLGVDFGDKRTGLAVSNEARTLASGIGQISVGGMQKTAAAVADVARERGVTAPAPNTPKNLRDCSATASPKWTSPSLSSCRTNA